MMKTIEKIKRLIEFMNIPIIDEKLSLKIQEWEILFEPEINEFRSLTKRLGLMPGKQLHYEQLKALRDQQTIHVFKFTKASHPQETLKNSWTLESIQPDMEVEQQIKVFQTEEFLQLLEDSPFSPKFTRKILEHQTGPGKPKHQYKISVQKISTHKVVGMICLHDDNNEYFPFSGSDTVKHRQVNTENWMEKKNEENMYIELFRFMEKYPEVKDHIFFYFRSVLKPNALLKEKEIPGINSV